MTYLFSLLFLFTLYSFNAQIGIGTNSPDSSALLDLVATNKGFSIPNVQLNGEGDAVTIEKPQKGLMVYHTGNNELLEGFYYNAGSSTTPIWSRLYPSSDLTTGSTIERIAFSPINTANTMTIGDIEVRHSAETNTAQIRFTNLNQGETFSYVTFVIQNWSGLNSSVDSGMCTASDTFTTICNSNGIAAGEHNDIWIYFIRNSVYYAYNYQVSAVNIGGTLYSSQLIELF